MKQQITYIPIEKLIPHPDNPRKNLGDLSELADSIKESGVYQNLTVVPDGENYKIIIGHRRRAAAELAGLTELPCIITEMTADEQLATMLLENMQRSDLTIVEQAQGMQMMLDIGFSADEISKKTGFSKSTVDKRLKVAALPKEEAKEAEARGGKLDDFIQLSKIKDEKTRNHLLTQIGTRDFDWNFIRAIERQTAEENKPIILAHLKETELFELPTGYWCEEFEPEESIDFSEENTNIREIFETIEKYNDKDHGYWFFETYFVIKKKVPKQTAQKVKKSEKEKQADHARAELQKKFEQMYQARQKFINDFSAHNKYRETIISALVFYTLRRSEDGQYYYNRKYLEKTIGYASNNSVADRIKEIKEFVKKPEAAFAALVASFEDKEGLNCVEYYNWGEKFPEHKADSRLSAIYEILCSLGYQLSTEEQQLLDGTHELYGG